MDVPISANCHVRGSMGLSINGVQCTPINLHDGWFPHHKSPFLGGYGCWTTPKWNGSASSRGARCQPSLHVSLRQEDHDCMRARSSCGLVIFRTGPPLRCLKGSYPQRLARQCWPCLARSGYWSWRKAVYGAELSRTVELADGTTDNQKLTW